MQSPSPVAWTSAMHLIQESGPRQIRRREADGRQGWRCSSPRLMDPSERIPRPPDYRQEEGISSYGRIPQQVNMTYSRFLGICSSCTSNSNDGQPQPTPQLCLTGILEDAPRNTTAPLISGFHHRGPTPPSPQHVPDRRLWFASQGMYVCDESFHGRCPRLCFGGGKGGGAGKEEADGDDLLVGLVLVRGVLHNLM